MNEASACNALAAGFAAGVQDALRAERPDLSWEVRLGPVDGPKASGGPDAPAKAEGEC